MTWKKIKPTDPIMDDIALYLGRAYLPTVKPRVATYPPRVDTMDAWRIVTAVLSHPDAAGLFADEDALRAAREQGWDEAAQHIYNKGWEGVTALRKANPHRPALSLPTDAFATNPPADADRPWEPLNGPVRVGDEVRQEAFGFAVTAVVARVDGRGDPLTAEGAIIGDLRHGTWYVRRTVPADTPPAEDVELPGERPAHLLDVKITGRAKCARMELDRYGYWIGVDQEGYPRQWPLRWIAAFTLPDGTRARRDGEHEDGEPRFVKVQEGEK